MSNRGDKEKKRIAILGSTGSIGRQALDVIARNSDFFSAEVLTANKNADLLIKQALEFEPDSVVISDESLYKKVSEALEGKMIKVYTGKESVNSIVESENVDMVLSSLVGYAGLFPTINAIKHKKDIALANKETLVIAGELITKIAIENNVNIIPVDSEHSAIFQCITGEAEYGNSIEKIYLTASGGPFRKMSYESLCKVTSSQALKHPTWNMGSKVTIDSASLMNKGLEAIEAKWLFNINPEQIIPLIHPQSIIHSMVQFRDGSIKAQMGLPDMRLPIQYAFSFPFRLKSDFPRLNFMENPNLTFEFPDTKRFPNLNLAFEAMKKGGNMPCILNAANEMAVEAFLSDKIGFYKMTEIIESSMEKVSFVKNPSYDDYVETDKESRNYAKTLI